MKMKPIPLEALLEMFDVSVRPQIQAQADKPSVVGLVVFENLQMDSSAFGARSCLSVGPGFTYKSPAMCEGSWLNDLPSQRKCAVAFWVKPGRVCQLCSMPCEADEQGIHFDCTQRENHADKYIRDYANLALTFAEEGYADGGEPYTDEELDIINKGL